MRLLFLNNFNRFIELINRTNSDFDTHIYKMKYGFVIFISNKLRSSLSKGYT